MSIVPSPNPFPIAKRLIFARAERVVIRTLDARGDTSTHARYHSRGALSKKFDVVFCSDLKRAHDFAKLAWESVYEIIPDARLRECNTVH